MDAHIITRETCGDAIANFTKDCTSNKENFMVWISGLLIFIFCSLVVVRFKLACNTHRQYPANIDASSVHARQN
jgi:hypothetical protein